MMNKNHKSFVCGLKCKYLSKDEKKFLIKHKPWGIILFSRNIKTIKQTKKLDSIGSIVPACGVSISFRHRSKGLVKESCDACKDGARM